MNEPKTQQEIDDRNEILEWADLFVRASLGDRWTLELHMEEKAAVLALLDAHGITSFHKKESPES